MVDDIVEDNPDTVIGYAYPRGARSRNRMLALSAIRPRGLVRTDSELIRSADMLLAHAQVAEMVCPSA